jgi:hypothetical protein
MGVTQAVTGAAEHMAPRKEESAMTPADRDDLISTIAYALKHKCHGLIWKRGQEYEGAARLVAADIAKHLELANFRIFRGPPSNGTAHNFPGSIKARER